MAATIKSVPGSPPIFITSIDRESLAKQPKTPCSIDLAFPWRRWERDHELDWKALNNPVIGWYQPSPVLLRVLAHLTPTQRLAVEQNLGIHPVSLHLASRLSEEHYLLSSVVMDASIPDQRRLVAQMYEDGTLSDSILIRAAGYGLLYFVVAALGSRLRLRATQWVSVIGAQLTSGDADVLSWVWTKAGGGDKLVDLFAAMCLGFKGVRVKSWMGPRLSFMNRIHWIVSRQTPDVARLRDADLDIVVTAMLLQLADIDVAGLVSAKAPAGGAYWVASEEEPRTISDDLVPEKV